MSEIIVSLTTLLIVIVTSSDLNQNRRHTYLYTNFHPEESTRYDPSKPIKRNDFGLTVTFMVFDAAVL